MPCIHLKAPNNCAFSFYLLSFSIYSLFHIKQKKKMSSRRKTSVWHKEENENFEKKSEWEVFKEIVQYYFYYHWCGLILRPFHYLTKKKKKIWLTKKSTTQTVGNLEEQDNEIKKWSNRQRENLIDLEVQLNIILRQYLPPYKSF